MTTTKTIDYKFTLGAVWDDDETYHEIMIEYSNTRGIVLSIRPNAESAYQIVQPTISELDQMITALRNLDYCFSDLVKTTHHRLNAK